MQINHSDSRPAGRSIQASACGMRTTTDNPPRSDFEKVNSPPFTWTRSETIDNPSPQPGLFSSRRLPRRAASPASAGGNPGPSSSIERTRPLPLSTCRYPDAARRPFAGVFHQVAENFLQVLAMAAEGTVRGHVDVDDQPAVGEHLGEGTCNIFGDGPNEGSGRPATDRPPPRPLRVRGDARSGGASC